MYFTVYTHIQHSGTRNIFSSLCIKSRVKILNSSAKYWGGQIQYGPQPNYWRGHGPPAPPPPIAPPCPTTF